MRVLGVAFVANGFVCLAVALFDPCTLLGSRSGTGLTLCREALFLASK